MLAAVFPATMVMHRKWITIVSRGLSPDRTVRAVRQKFVFVLGATVFYATVRRTLVQNNMLLLL